MKFSLSIELKVSDKMHVVVKILLKALANLPHTDFVLCKCLLSQEVLDEPQVNFGLNLGIELL